MDHKSYAYPTYLYGRYFTCWHGCLLFWLPCLFLSLCVAEPLFPTITDSFPAYTLQSNSIPRHMTRLGQSEHHIPSASEMGLNVGVWPKPGSCEQSSWISDGTGSQGLQEPMFISRNFANQLLNVAIIKKLDYMNLQLNSVKIKVLNTQNVQLSSYSTPFYYYLFS